MVYFPVSAVVRPQENDRRLRHLHCSSAEQSDHAVVAATASDKVEIARESGSTINACPRLPVAPDRRRRQRCRWRSSPCGEGQGRARSKSYKTTLWKSAALFNGKFNKLNRMLSAPASIGGRGTRRLRELAGAQEGSPCTTPSRGLAEAAPISQEIDDLLRSKGYPSGPLLWRWRRASEQRQRIRHICWSTQRISSGRPPLR